MEEKIEAIIKKGIEVGNHKYIIQKRVEKMFPGLSDQDFLVLFQNVVGTKK